MPPLSTPGRSFAQGSLQRTDRPLDVAIQGEGFLRVRLPDGRDALTRDGSLHVDGAGRLTTSTGALVQPAIKVPDRHRRASVSIGADGTVTAAGRRIGRLDARHRPLAAGLHSAGDNAFVTTAASGAAAAAPRRDRAHAGRPGGLQHRHGRRHGRDDRVPALLPARLEGHPTADQMMEIANGVKR